MSRSTSTYSKVMREQRKAERRRQKQADLRTAAEKAAEREARQPPDLDR